MLKAREAAVVRTLTPTIAEFWASCRDVLSLQKSAVRTSVGNKGGGSRAQWRHSGECSCLTAAQGGKDKQTEQADGL